MIPRKRNRRTLAWLLALCLALTQLVFAGTVTVQAQEQESERVFGADRYKTAVAISQSSWEQADVAVLARGDDFADALCAGPYAHFLGGPILLTRPDRIDPEVLGEIKRLGAKRVVLIGGLGAVSSGVEQTLRNEGIENLERIGGKDRFETSVLIAEKLGNPQWIALATGRDFPDALSISAIASRQGMPILLTDRDRLPDSVREYLNGREIEGTYVIGGGNVIGQGLLSGLTNPLRLAGEDRYGTNVAVLAYFQEDLNFDTIFVAVGGGARGNEFADALTGAVLAARNGSALVLTYGQLPAVTEGFLKSVLKPESRVIALGGANVVSPPVVDRIKGLIAAVVPAAGGGGGGGSPGSFAGGAGTAASPYRIATAAQLNNVRNHLDKHFTQTADIDLGIAPWNEGAGWEPIGTNTVPFTGSYNGNSKTISNLTIDRPDEGYIGLFGKNSGTIENVSLSNVEISGQWRVGGLLGHNEGGVVTNSNATGTVTASSGAAGGLMGWNDEDSEVTGCYSAGSVSAVDSHYVGGLMGASYDSIVTDSYSTSSVAGGDYFIGGLAGSNADGTIAGCYATGDVTGGSDVGGLVGDNVFGGVITDSYATGRVTGSSGETGGLVGDNHSAEIRNSYAIGLVICGGSDVGGLVGRNSSGGTVTAGFYDAETANQSDNTGKGTPKTTAEMTTQATFVGWNFAGPDGVWAIKTAPPTASYPYFQWQETENIPYPPFAGGDGTAADPYQVAVAAQLNNVRNHLDKHFIQTADIDLNVASWNAGEGWKPIGTFDTPFTGSYDGNGWTISNLTIDRPDQNDIGLFGRIPDSGSVSISGVSLINVDIKGGGRVGALVGYNGCGTISDCSSAGVVTGDSYVGGLVGWNYYGAVITASHAATTVTASSDSGESGGESGGLVGANWGGTIDKSYATGAVTGVGFVGGLAGSNSPNAHIIESYATGAVTGGGYTGGLAGTNGTNSTIANSYATGAVTSSGTHYVGGLVGGNYNSSAITNSYAIGAVTVTGSGGNVGGLIGGNYNGGAVANSFYDQVTTGQSDTGKGTPKTTVEMKTQATFAGWNFTAGTGIWAIDTEPPAASYPYLQWQGMYLPSEFAGGSGTAADPYQVATAEQLDKIRDYLDKHFILTDNIDLGAAPWNQDEGWVPIGQDPSTDRFAGSLDGDGYTISNLTINKNGLTYGGLFGAVGFSSDYEQSAQFRDIRLEDVQISGNNLHTVGSLIGRSDSNLTVIDNCSAAGTITHSLDTGYALGGLIGSSQGSTVQNCYAEVTVSVGTTGHKTGGLIGDNSGKILNSYAQGDISGGDTVGGLVGWNAGGAEISGCFSLGTVTGVESVGGLAGVAWGTIEESFSSAYVQGTQYHVGGLAGTVPGKVYNSYATGNVSGGSNTGGLAGSFSGGGIGVPGEIVKCYASGTVTGSSNLGGLVGSIWASSSGHVIDKSYYCETTGRNDTGKGIRQTIAEMTTKATFTGESWEFDGPDGVWAIETAPAAASYPYLQWQGTENIPYPPSGFAGGLGTELSPYQVATAEQLDNVRNHLEKHFIQTADIDLSEYLAEDGAGYNAGACWEPIGSNSLLFTGSYNGNGKKINNLKIVRPEQDYYVGLFGRGTCSISNVSLLDVDINGKNHVGGLIGENNWGIITDSNVTGSVKGTGNRIGGLLGSSYDDEISRCYSTCSVEGNNDVAGLIGYNDYSLISKCYATGDIKGNGSTAGGLVASNYQGVITECFAAGSVNGEYDEVGGLVGWNAYSEARIANSYATGQVTGGGERIGGLVGRNQDLAVVDKCYATGKVTGGTKIGGLVGETTENAITTNSYWDTETSGRVTSAGGTGYTTSAMIKETNSVLIYDGWNFDEPDGVWTIIAGTSYPYLQWQGAENIPYPPSGFAGGLGTELSPYQVATAEQLDNVRNHLDKHFIQTANIDLTIVGEWTPIGHDNTEPQYFTGSYDGQGYSISNLSIDAPEDDFIGLFAAVQNATLKNIVLEDVDIIGNNQTGSLAGIIYSGTIIACSASGEVTGTMDAGGLAGKNSGTIRDSFAAAKTTGENAGGLVGYNDGGTLLRNYATGEVEGTGGAGAGGLVGFSIAGSISQCFASGNVSNIGSSGIGLGGLLGNGNTSITNCYATGSVSGYGALGSLAGGTTGHLINNYAIGAVSGTGDIGGLIGWVDGVATRTNNYYDSETTGHFSSVVGEAKTTTEMMTLSTFTGWDFADIWSINEDNSYPYLQWQPMT